MRHLRNGLRRLTQDGPRATYDAARRELEPAFYERVYLPAIERSPGLVGSVCRRHPRFSDADPFELRWVDPSRIREVGDKRLPIYLGQLRSGDWDRRHEPFEDRWAARGVAAYLERGDDSVLREHYYEHRAPYNDIEDASFEERLAEIDALCDSLGEHGYRSRRQQLIDGTLPAETHESVLFPVELDEIIVNIGRNGELQRLYNGQHRLAIANHLDLDAVAVLVARRHPEWQAVRDETRERGGLPPGVDSDIGEHPDLCDLRDDDGLRRR